MKLQIFKLEIWIGAPPIQFFVFTASIRVQKHIPNHSPLFQQNPRFEENNLDTFYESATNFVDCYPFTHRYWHVKTSNGFMYFVCNLQLMWNFYKMKIPHNPPNSEKKQKKKLLMRSSSLSVPRDSVGGSRGRCTWLQPVTATEVRT